MKTLRQRDRRRGSGRLTWHRVAAGRLSRAEEESRGGSPNAGPDGRVRETRAEREKDMKEGRQKLSLKRGRSCEDPVDGERLDSAPGPCPSPACGDRTLGQGDRGKISFERERSEKGQERSGPRDSEVATSSSDRSRKRRRMGAEEESWPSSYSSSSTPSPVNCTSTQGPAPFASLYVVGSLLGEGGCGSVYAGTRRADGLPVAIKVLTAGYSRTPVYIAGLSRPVPLEVALMVLACRPPASPNLIQLLDWFEGDEVVIVVLELPSPCMDVHDFIAHQGGRLGEDLAKLILAQVVQAAIHCRDRGVLHRDIKPENLLIRTDNLGVKLIDFGCGDLLSEYPYTSFAGTMWYAPPEWFVDGAYCGRPATVWSLGVVLFALVCGSLPFGGQQGIIRGELRFKEGLSDGCKNLIQWCLRRDPRDRPELEEVLEHPWMSQWSC